MTTEELQAQYAILADRYNLLDATLQQHLRDHSIMDMQVQRRVGEQLVEVIARIERLEAWSGQ